MLTRLFFNSAQAEIEMERGARTQAIADRTAEAEASRQIEHWRKKREHARSEYAAEMRGDMSKDEETALMTRLDTQVKQQEQAKREHDVQSKKAFTLEEAFQQIRQVCSVSMRLCVCGHAVARVLWLGC